MMAVRSAQAKSTDKPGDLSLNWITAGSLNFGQVSVVYDDTQSSGELMAALELLKTTMLEDIER